jgi:hypothetical protein
VTSPAVAFIVNHPGWSVRHTRPGPCSTGSIAQITTGMDGGCAHNRTSNRSNTDNPRGPMPTMATCNADSGSRRCTPAHYPSELAANPGRVAASVPPIATYLAIRSSIRAPRSAFQGRRTITANRWNATYERVARRRLHDAGPVPETAGARSHSAPLITALR